MANKEKNTREVSAQQDDALFEVLDKNRKRKKKRIIITVVSIVAAVAILAVAGVSILQKKVREQFGGSGAEVQSHTVTTGTISTVVSGSGSLTDVDLQSITVPAGVTVNEVKVRRNASVDKGTVLATVDMASVISAMAELQTQIDELDDQISDAEGDATGSSVTAGVAGRVKAVFAKKDEKVSEIMYENGALALLSLDGYMSFELETKALKAGDKITVVRANGKKITGNVENVVAGVATVLVTDNGPAYEEEVTAQDADGKELGKAKLAIHSPLRITGYAGTVSAVKVSAGDKVSASTKLFTLKDTQYSANYETLLRQRGEKEEDLLALLKIQHDGAVLADEPGSVQSVDFTENSEDGETPVVTLSKDEKMSVTVTVDEDDILSLELGQQVYVTVSSVSEDAFAGTLTEIDRSGSSGSYSAVVELQKASGMLSGMTASVSVQIEGVDNALLIPVEALHLTSDGAYVYTSYDPQREEYGGKVDVVTGLQNSTYVEIKSGLQEGDTVYYVEQQENSFGGFGNMGGFDNMGGGQMPNFGGSGGQMPNFGGSGGQMPNFGGSGGQRPNFSGSGGQRPSGSGSSNRPNRSGNG